MRRGFRLAVGLVFCLGPLASCGGGPGKFDLTLRSRQGASNDPPPDCDFWLDPHHPETTRMCVLQGWGGERWFAADGRGAVMRAATVTTYFSSRLDEPVTCNGHKPVVYAWWFKWTRPTGGPVLTIDDGDELAFHDEKGLTIEDGVGIPCFESSGRWSGTAGRLLGRQGTFTMVYDSVQTVLHLVED